MSVKSLPILLLTLLCCCPSIVCAQTQISEQAWRNFDRGTAAVETATSRQDLEAAVREFEEAARLAPDWPDVSYNLGLIREQLDDLDGAIAAFRRYLQLAPQADDAAAIRTQINKLEYRRDKQAQQARILAQLEGTWKGFMGFCGGNTSELRFFKWKDDQVFVEMLTGWNANPGVAIDPQSHPVKIEGQNVRFSFRSRLIVPQVMTDYCDIRFELSLVEPGHLKGNIFSNGYHVQDLSLKKQ
jgi:Tfp pilus assembly protein PilF